MIENKWINIVMNSFNRLLSLYIDLFLIENILYDYSKKNEQNFRILKKCVYLQYRKKPSKIAIMEKESDIEKKRNYRITIILRDEIIVEKFYRQDIAIKTIKGMKELSPGMFIGGAIEEKKGKWKIIWTLK